MKSDPKAVMFNRTVGEHSLELKVYLCIIGNAGANRSKNIWRHVSRYPDVNPVLLISAVILEDCVIEVIIHEIYKRGQALPNHG